MPVSPIAAIPARSRILFDAVKWWRFPRVVGVLVAVYLLAIAMLFARLSLENHSFLANATSTKGTVIALVPRTFSGGERGPGLHRLRGVPLAPEVSYTVGGVPYTYTPVTGRYKPTVRVGDTVTIIYSPDDPAGSARIEGEGRIIIPVITIGFTLLAIGVVVLLIRTRRTGTSARPLDGADAAAGSRRSGRREVTASGG